LCAYPPLKRKVWATLVVHASQSLRELARVPASTIHYNRISMSFNPANHGTTNYLKL
jgi:hypothetical protein